MPMKSVPPKVCFHKLRVRAYGPKLDTSPVNWLEPMLSQTRLAQFFRLAGIGPENLFIASMNCSRLPPLQTSEGSSPERELLPPC